MSYIYSVLGIILTTCVTYFLMKPRKSDQILSELNLTKKKEREERAVEIAKLTEEVKNAKIDYENARRDYDAITGESLDSDEDM